MKAAFNHLHEKLDRYIWKLALSYAKSSGRMHQPEDFHQEGLLKLWDICVSHSDVPLKELEQLCKLYIQNRFKDVYRREKDHLVVCVGDLTELLSVGVEDFNEVYLSHYVEHLASLVSEEARVLLRMRMFPSDELLYEHYKTISRRNHLQMTGVLRRCVVELTWYDVGDFLNYTRKRTKELVKELREAWTHQAA